MLSDKGVTFAVGMAPEEYKQLTAFSRIDGIYVGILWIISFAFSIVGLSSGIVGFVGTLLAILSPIYAYIRLRKFRDYALEGTISFGRAMLYYVFIFFYASLIFALAQVVYFQFMDNGYMLKTYETIVLTPETIRMLALYGLSHEDLLDSVRELASTSPIVMALNVMSFNIAIGIVLSIPMAFIAKKNGYISNNTAV